MADYSIEFRTLAAEAGWDEGALHSIFVQGLDEVLQDELAFRDEPSSLDPLILFAILLDNHLRDRKSTERGRNPISWTPRATHSPRGATSQFRNPFGGSRSQCSSAGLASPRRNGRSVNLLVFNQLSDQVLLG